MTVINTNTAATLTANALSSNQRAMNQTMERLSTGSRINSAQDDAAGLTQVSKMDSQIRGTNMAIRNTQEAISMIQTADGAAIEIDSMLQRMRELAVQALNNTNTTADLTNLNKEFAELATEIDRVASTTEYNDTLVLAGTAGTAGVFDFHVGANSQIEMTDSKVSVDFGDLSMNGGAATAGVQKITMTDANMISGSATTDSFLVTLDSGQTMTISAAVVAGTDATDASDVTASEFADAFNTANGNVDDNGASFVEITAVYAAGDNSITFTEGSGNEGLGSIASIVRVQADGTKVALANSSGTVTTSTTGESAGGSSVYGADISKFKTAGTLAENTATLAELDTAIAGLATQRATYGAAINRFEYTIDNLSNVSQNTVASRSRIEDADYAAETSELARTQIIAQAATAMLSQANQQAQSVLALLK